MTNHLEARMRRVCKLLRDHQVAKLFKFPEEMQSTPCDFMGHDSKGHAILIECKQVNRPSLSVKDRPGLRPHQWLALREAAATTAFSFIMWQRGDTIAIVSTRHAEALTEERVSVPWSETTNHVNVAGLTRDAGDRALLRELALLLRHPLG